MTLLSDAPAASLPEHDGRERFNAPTSSVPAVPLPPPSAEPPARRGRMGAVLAAAALVALKLFKAAKAVKILLFGAFIWSLALNHPLPFAIALAYAILVHEAGHLLAMKRCGLKTTGIYFLPFLGAAAVAKQGFRSHGEEFFIAIAGPVFGLLSLAPLFALAVLLPGGSASTAAWFGYASAAAFVNLFNLLPIGILDGGRIVKSLSSSLSRVLGFIVVGGGLLLCAVLVAWVGGAILGAILAISIVELLRSRKRQPLPAMSRGAVLGGTAAYVGLFAVLALLTVVGSNLARGVGPF
jgi:Zn-dependent protease